MESSQICAVLHLPTRGRRSLHCTPRRWDRSRSTIPLPPIPHILARRQMDLLHWFLLHLHQHCSLPRLRTAPTQQALRRLPLRRLGLLHITRYSDDARLHLPVHAIVSANHHHATDEAVGQPKHTNYVHAGAGLSHLGGRSASSTPRDRMGPCAGGGRGAGRASHAQCLFRA